MSDDGRNEERRYWYTKAFVALHMIDEAKGEAEEAIEQLTGMARHLITDDSYSESLDRAWMATFEKTPETDRAIHAKEAWDVLSKWLHGDDLWDVPETERAILDAYFQTEQNE